MKAPDLVAPRPDWMAAQSAPLPRPMDAYAVWRAIAARPLPGLGLAMRIRDVVSGWFGVQPLEVRAGWPAGGWPDNPRPGDRLDFFTVERTGPDILTLAARDRHLDTITCITTDNRDGAGRVTVTSSVVWHNRFGRIYMLPVAPAHRVIVRLMLRRLC